MHGGTFYDSLYMEGERRKSRYWTKKQYDMIKQFWEHDKRNIFAEVDDLDELKKMFREEAKKHHPDKFQNPIEKERHTELFIKVKKQYEERIREIAEDAKNIRNAQQRRQKTEKIAVFVADYMKEFYPTGYDVLSSFYQDKKFVLNIIKTFFPNLQDIADIIELTLEKK